MPSANAAVKAKEMKTAQKAIAARGVTKPPKHTPKENSGTQVAMVESGHSTSTVEVGNQSNVEPQMTQEAEMQAQAGRRATDPMVEVAVQVTTKPKTRKEIHAEEVAARKAIRDAETAQRRAAREAEQAALKAAGKGYVGSMLSLAERVKAGAYVKSMTGQLRSTDEVAVALDAVPPKNVIPLALEALKLESNPYAALNVGQQSMNLRNKLRGAVKAGTLTIDVIKAIRDSKGYATAEKERAEKAEAKAAAAKKREEEKAKKEADKKATADAAAKQAETNAKAQLAAENAAKAKESEPERQSMDAQSTQTKSVKRDNKKK